MEREAYLAKKRQAMAEALTHGRAQVRVALLEEAYIEVQTPEENLPVS